ncbi:MAG: MarR family transcriptional regulator, partial [Mesorhizobium sp.]
DAELATVLRFIDAALELQSEQLARLKAEPASAG